jgi:hypothetical protein
MTRRVRTLTATETTEIAPAGVVTVVLESEEKSFPLEQLGLTYDSTSDEIMRAVSAPLLDDYGVDLNDNVYVVRKLQNGRDVLLFPKSVAG